MATNKNYSTSGFRKLTNDIRKIRAGISKNGDHSGKHRQICPEHPDKPKLNTVNLLSGKRLKTIYSDEPEFLFTAYAQRPDKKARDLLQKQRIKKGKFQSVICKPCGNTVIY